jgi:hypothetical protein
MVAVILLIGFYYRDWRKIVLASLVPLLIVAGWDGKNLLLFQTFGASSWAGMNLSHVTFLSPLTSQSVRGELVSQGKLNPYPVREAFRAIEDYDGLFPIPPERGIPVLDENIKSKKAVKFNNLYYLPLSNRMRKDALNFIRSRPGLYLDSVKQGFSIYFHSSSDYLLLKDKPTPTLESWWDRIFYGQLSSYNENYDNRWNDDPRYVGWLLVLAYVVATIFGLRVVLTRENESPVFVSVIAFITFTIIYFTLTANFLDLGENNRFRFTLDPFVLLLFGRLLQDFVIHFSRRTKQETSAN